MKIIISILLIITSHTLSFGQLIDSSQITVEQQKYVNEHCPYGLPDNDNLLVRQPYVLSYLLEYKIPQWVCYHIIADYRNTPKRKSRFKSYRADKSVSGSAKSSTYRNTGHDVGHIAPFGISGGDRDNDGKYANLDDATSDDYDEATVFHINLMTNMTPQLPGFNRRNGLWYNLERWLQDEVIEDADGDVTDLWIVAGVIIEDEDDWIGEGEKKVLIPDGFFKICIVKLKDESYSYLAFLFPHEIHKDDNLIKYLKSVDTIEQKTGLDFFSELETESWYDESKCTLDNWTDNLENILTAKKLK